MLVAQASACVAFIPTQGTFKMDYEYEVDDDFKPVTFRSPRS